MYSSAILFNKPPCPLSPRFGTNPRGLPEQKLVHSNSVENRYTGFSVGRASKLSILDGYIEPIKKRRISLNVRQQCRVLLSRRMVTRYFFWFSFWEPCLSIVFFTYLRLNKVLECADRMWTEAFPLDGRFHKTVPPFSGSLPISMVTLKACVQVLSAPTWALRH